MSRVGKEPITVPSGVQVTIDGSTVRVQGPKGELSRSLHKDMIIDQADGVITVRRPSEQRDHKALHGLTRTLIANMVHGVTNGYEKKLELVGTGYRASKQGDKLVLTLGYSHPVEMQPPEGVEVEVPKPTEIIVRGTNKEHVGQFTANIRAVRPPEPYLGKGVRYAGERVRRKEGKAGKK